MSDLRSFSSIERKIIETAFDANQFAATYSFVAGTYEHGSDEQYWFSMASNINFNIGPEHFRAKNGTEFFSISFWHSALDAVCGRASEAVDGR